MISVGMPHISSLRKERLDRFADYVSVLPWFNVNVLHKLYMNVFEALERLEIVEKDRYKWRAIVCGDLVHSTYVLRVSYNVFVIQPEIQDALRARIQKEENVIEFIADFMLAYVEECQGHFIGPKYQESFRIEANLILDPTREAGRITKHIADRLNQVSDFGQKKNSVAYFLNILQKSNPSPEQEQLIEFLKGYQKFDPEKEISDEWKNLKNKNDGQNETITIKLPRQIKKSILEEIQEKIDATNISTLHAVIVGIDNYIAKDIFPLDSAEKDANAIHEYLLNNRNEQMGFKPDVILGVRATKKEVLESLFQSVNQCVEHDHLLFYFAGYGAMESDQRNQLYTQSNIGEQNIAVEQSGFNSLNGERALVCHDTSVGDCISRS